MLEAVSARVPAIYKFCHFAYNQLLVLKFFEHRIISAEGPQQGDPLRGLLFCNTVLRRMNSNVVEGYMDDIMLGGKSDIVAEDVATIRTLGSGLGLHLNAKKCELIQRCPTTTEPAFREFVITSKEDATLLGAPLTYGPALNESLEARCADLDRAIGRLSLLPAHDALTLLKSSFSVPKIMYMHRSSPCHGHEALDKFDYLLRTGLGNLSISDIQWIQASLPVSIGGLGARLFGIGCSHTYSPVSPPVQQSSLARLTLGQPLEHMVNGFQLNHTRSFI